MLLKHSHISITVSILLLIPIPVNAQEEQTIIQPQIPLNNSNVNPSIRACLRSFCTFFTAKNFSNTLLAKDIIRAELNAKGLARVWNVDYKTLLRPSCG